VDSSGTVQERYGYDAYGLPTVLTPGFVVRVATLFDWEIRYAAYRWDDESGLYQVRIRVLQTSVGWVQRDPHGLSAGTNLYEYVSSVPITAVDTFGLAPLKPVPCGPDFDPVPVPKGIGKGPIDWASCWFKDKIMGGGLCCSTAQAAAADACCQLSG